MPIDPRDTAGAVGIADANDVAEVQRVDEGAGIFGELGSTGLKRAAGYVDEEFLPQLRGRKAVQIYREMSDNDPIVGAMLYSVVQLLQNVEWNVKPQGKGREATAAAKFLESVRDDMSHSWANFVGETLSCLTYGWAWCEPVYKRRVGPWERDPRQRSKYSDGMIGWRKIPLRGQETLMRWVFDEDGSVVGMVQMAPPDYKSRVLPINRSLLFRTNPIKDNPEGRSVLRNAYRPWFYKKRLEEHEAIGVERDLAGLPIAYAPADWIRAQPGSPQGKSIASLRKLVKSVRRDEQEGLVFPRAYDEATKQPIFDFQLLGGGGSRAFNTDTIIQRYEQRILMTMLADFIMIGHQRTGTYNLHVDKTGIFRQGLNSINQNIIAEVLNRHAVPRLFALNGWRPAELPTFEPTDIDSPDLSQLGQFLGATAQLGYQWGPDAEIERYLRQAAGLPDLSETDFAERQQLSRKAEATRFAETQTAYLAARSQLAQAQVNEALTMAGQPTPDDHAAMAAGGVPGQSDPNAQPQQRPGLPPGGAR